MGNHFGRSMTVTGGLLPYVAPLHFACLVDVAPNELVSICGDADIRIHFDVVKPRYRRPPFYALETRLRSLLVDEFCPIVLMWSRRSWNAMARHALIDT
ncbi:hypothetical protein T12_10139 [Trichinella patagoniensis]|uniref:Uncharacterized protein n=1 Tax=Trichinella patagoniensis TaxID=990121 RepID=A0A0V1A490_9BILA|nr:hypothetical protein T12_10139 [Trichinella patagoniensis]